MTMDHSSARPYQLELLDAALEDNSIVLLGTGAGKTLIAVLLIRDLSHMILGSYNDDPSAKRTIFLVNTVPLVTQQASYIKTHTSLNVGEYCGEMGVDDWNQIKWNYELENNHILVMTKQIFLNMLSHGFMNISRVNLLIFDECHHAVKNDPYVQIMKHYNQLSEDQRPRILGLSASIISGKCKPEQLCRKLKDLERTLCSRAQTAKDLAQVAKYATNPDESIQVYSNLSNNSNVLCLKSILSGILEFIQLSVKPGTKVSIASILVTFLSECIYVLQNVSISSAIEAVGLIRTEINELLNTKLSIWDTKLCELTLLKLAVFSYECNSSTTQESDGYSPKFTELLKVLIEFNSQIDARSSENDIKFCGIIFVEQRSTAVCLSRLLQKLQGNLLRHIKCHFIVGHSTSGGKTLEQSMNVKKQQEVLRKFRSEKLNLLVATSVVEEGLDIPKCNMVIRYDFPKTFQSHVQSKGRARAKNSRYLLLVHQDDLPEKLKCLKEYIEIEKTLSKLCHDREVPNEDEIERRLRYKIPPYQPSGPDGPSVSINESLSLLHKYCQKLPTDRYTVLAPEFEVNESENDIHRPLIDGYTYDHLYLATVCLPMSSPVNEATGMALPRVSLAKKTAALEAIKLLHEAKELDDHLKPVTHEDSDSDGEDEDKMDAKKTKHAGTHRKITYYKNKVASCLKGGYPNVGDTNYLYVFVISDKNTGKHYQLTENGYCTTLGLLTSKPLPYTKIPPFSLYIGHTEMIVNLIETKHSIESKTEYELYETFHKVLFSDILSIKKLNFSIETSERSYLIVPVLFAPKVSLSFLDEELMKEIVQFPSANLVTPTWPFDWYDKLVIKNYTEDKINDKPQLYEILSCEPATTPLSIFPDQNTMTYAQYFNSKYGHVFTHYDDPALICRPISSGINSLRLILSRFKNTAKPTNTALRISEIKLFPELCKVWPISASFWKYSRCIPSIIKRIESLLLVNELSNEISIVTNIGIGPTYEYEQKSELLNNNFTTNYATTHHSIVPTTATCTYQPVNGYTNNSNELIISNSSIFYSNSGKVFDDETACHLEHQVDIDCVLRRPNNLLLLQSLTPSGANDSFDLERLETLGDSFLKLSTTISLFCYRCKNHEGKLTQLRQNRISNFNLSYLAKKKALPLSIFSQSFDPFSNWIPPCFNLPLQNSSSIPLNQSRNLTIPSLMAESVPPETLPKDIQNYYYHKMTDKGIADCVEALIGAYIISGGIESGLTLMKEWIGIKCPKTSPDSDMTSCPSTCTSRTLSQSSSMSIECPPLESCGINYPSLYKNSSFIFTSLYAPPSPLLREDVDEDVIFKMIAPCVVPGNNRETLCERLSWTFSNSALLLEALTHPSYTKNRYTGSYQRLEFLGDAVLDYLVTCCLYSEFPHYTPGQLTEARSVLVNNINFAEISVKNLKLHTCLLYRAPGLFKLINEYVNYIAPNDGTREEEEEKVMYCQYEKDDSSDRNVMDLPLEEYADEDEDDNEMFEILEPPKVLGDVLESVAGALFIDSGMSLETVWQRFYPFFKPTIDKFKVDAPPVHPLQELLKTNPTIEIAQDQPRRSKHRCTIKVINKEIQVSCVASTFKAAKIGAARRILAKLKDLD